MITPKTQLQLRIDQEIKEQLDDILIKMQKMTKRFDIKQVKERSPFRNVLSVAVEPISSLETIKSFIRYQAARKEASKIWRLEFKPNGENKKEIFANAVVQEISYLSNNLQKIYDSISEDLNTEIQSLDDNSPVRKNLESLQLYLSNNKQYLDKSIHLELAKIYLGYLSREHTALVGGFEPNLNND